MERGQRGRHIGQLGQLASWLVKSVSKLLTRALIVRQPHLGADMAASEHVPCSSLKMSSSGGLGANNMADKHDDTKKGACHIMSYIWN